MEENGGGVEEEGKTTFYFLFSQNEFQGSSALGDVGVHGLTASDKHKFSSEGRTTSHHHLLCGHRQRKTGALDKLNKENRKMEENNSLKS